MIKKIISLCTLLTCSFGTVVGAPIEEFTSGVFFRTSSDPARVSVNFDNHEESWSIADEHDNHTALNTNDLSESQYEEARPTIISHFLYGFKDFQIAPHLEKELKGVLDSPQAGIFKPLGVRQPLILVHGWQGGKHQANYVGMNNSENLPEEYFQEFLAFYESGGTSSGSKAAQYLYKNYKIYLYHYPSFEHITYNGRLLGEAIKRNAEIWNHIQSNGKISIIAHSMGGLVARSFIEEHGYGFTVPLQHPNLEGNKIGTFIPDTSVDALSTIDKLITLATPHHGSPSSMKKWIDLSKSVGFVKKDIDTPGALDLFWDDSDLAISNLLGRDIGLSRNTYDDQALGEKVFYWKQRDGDGTSKTVERFDKYYGDEKYRVGADLPKEGLLYEEPNPWLRNLNEALFNQSPSNYMNKYYFYGGSEIDDDWIDLIAPEPHSYLIPPAWYNTTSQAIHVGGRYMLNDAVVPTQSAFLEYVSDYSLNKNDWEKDNLMNNLYSKINNEEFENPPLFYREGVDSYSHYRYFHDYDHKKMRGGSGHQEPDDFTTASDYDIGNWEDQNFGTGGDYAALLSDIRYPYSAETPNPNLSLNRKILYYEPLFLKIAMDLGFFRQVTEVAARGYSSCALDDSGVLCWGDDYYGQTSVPSLSNPTQVTVGTWHSCAVDDSGVVCWGGNDYSQSSVPVLSNPRQVAAGAIHTCALDDSGVVCWGDNSDGQSSVPVLSNPRQVAAGTRHSCALDESGVVCWGGNDIYRTVAAETIASLSNPRQVAVGVLDNDTCVLDDTGVVCWGRSYLGQGAISVPNLSNPTQVTVSAWHSCALDDSGVVCWGSNSMDFGQARVPSLSNPRQVAAGILHTCALDNTGVVCWGNNDAGQSRVPLRLGFAQAYTQDDFGGDGKADILTRHSGSGRLQLREMDGNISTVFDIGSLSTVWTVEGIADFGGDGKADILLRHSNNGQLYLYKMDGNQVTRSNISGLNLAWRVEGTGDLGGDGKADIVLRNINTGQLILFEMDGSQITRSNIGGLGLDWTVEAIDDFGGDGKADLLLRNSKNGQLYLYEMDGNQITRHYISGLKLAWRVEGTGDLGGDGKADIVLRNINTGQLFLFEMDGSQITRRNIGGLNLIWNVERIADYGGDGKADLLLRHSNNGQLYLYKMDSNQVTPSNIGGLNPVWEVQVQ